MKNTTTEYFHCGMVSMFLIIVSLLLTWILIYPKQIRCDYSRTITVDDANKIEQAIVNAKDDVKSRNFIIIDIDVIKISFIKKFKIIVKGVDKSSLLKY